jgi:hypothetical protein
MKPLIWWNTRVRDSSGLVKSIFAGRLRPYEICSIVGAWSQHRLSRIVFAEAVLARPTHLLIELMLYHYYHDERLTGVFMIKESPVYVSIMPQQPYNSFIINTEP